MLALRGPAILSIQTRIHVLSAEPLLGPLDLSHSDPVPGAGDVQAKTSPRGPRGFAWVIAGGESGPRARPSHADWFLSIRDQCIASDVPFHFKQWGEWAPGEPSYPKDLHVWQDGASVNRVGKRRAGRELDGRTWDETPSLWGPARGSPKRPQGPEGRGEINPRGEQR